MAGAGVSGSGLTECKASALLGSGVWKDCWFRKRFAISEGRVMLKARKVMSC